jgi:hypothetical protein
MALTLKTSGIATEMTMCLAVDDNNIVKEFVSSAANSAMTIDAGITYGTKSWKSVSRRYFETFRGANDYTPVKLSFSSNYPVFQADATNGGTVYIACAGYSAPLYSGGVISKTNGAPIYVAIGEFRPDGTITASTPSPTNGTTSFSTAFKITSGGTYKFYYGAESSADVAAAGTGSPGGRANTDVGQIGGGDGQGVDAGKWHLIALFNRQLEDVEVESLHDDWFGVLFDSSGSSSGAARNYYSQLSS